MRGFSGFYQVKTFRLRTKDMLGDADLLLPDGFEPISAYAVGSLTMVVGRKWHARIGLPARRVRRRVRRR